MNSSERFRTPMYAGFFLWFRYGIVSEESVVVREEYDN
jgi:hypothetical protein